MFSQVNFVFFVNVCLIYIILLFSYVNLPIDTLNSGPFILNMVFNLLNNHKV